MKTTKQFKVELSRYAPVKLLSEYLGAFVHVKLRCPKKHEWVSTPTTILAKPPGDELCPTCRIELRGYSRKKRKTNAQFLKELTIKGIKNIKPVSPYINATEHIDVQCRVCRHEWKMRPDNLLSGKGCPKCRDNKPDLSVAEIQERLSKHLHVTTKTIYTRQDDECKFKCSECKYKWISTPASIHRSVHGCPQCAVLSTGYKRKPFKIDGVRFNLQGYEHLALKWIHNHNKCSIQDVLHGKEVPRFTYGSRTYFPDFLIRGTKRIVEVKSDYTLLGRSMWFKNLLEKRQAVVEAGYKFTLLVFSRDEKLLNLPADWHNLSAKQLKSFWQPS